MHQSAFRELTEDMELPMNQLVTKGILSSSANDSPIARRGPIVLMYHAIDQAGHRTNSRWAISLNRFRAHLELLEKLNANCIGLTSVVENKAPPGSVCITFDDGYADNLLAAQMLQEHGMMATFFVVSGTIGRTCDWERPPLHGREMMSTDDLFTLTRLGMQIGSHGVSHARLTKLPREQQEVEIYSSRSELEAMLGEAPRYFAYPSGDYSTALEKIVAAAGYDAACSTRSGYHQGDHERFSIRRLSVFRQDSSARMARKLLLADNDGSWTRFARMYAKSAFGKLTQRLGH